ncbi:hypothetical protein [Pseudomonas putida]|uniref:Uncharacterized protein n=1 Tax=Pseudomonas putida TaxID=303 RepID=A0A8I1JJ97_PSEPU|nr:hypothetical protein [Pseudomonas putida]MBI6885847.1 hypothetical protein [Pseudomonas putida]
MAMEYITQAFGDGDIQKSPIFQSSFDWVFRKILEGRRVEVGDYSGFEATTINHADIKPFQLEKYELLHELLITEHVVEIEPVPNTQDDLTQEVYRFAEALRDTISFFAERWVKENAGLNGASPGAITQLVTMICTGMLSEFFKLEIKGPVFEQEFVRRCDSPATQTKYREIFGTEKALSRFPDSPVRGEWLESDLGL